MLLSDLALKRKMIQHKVACTPESSSRTLADGTISVAKFVWRLA